MYYLTRIIYTQLICDIQGRSQKIPKGGAKSGKWNRERSERKFFAFFLCKRDQNRTKTVICIVTMLCLLAISPLG